ncbi:uncharacterized protein LOC132283504 [Cornus florida]|uniref:uncharacterized protein LOC132283504 n=1 Tax=Cornus florida TaxID=4283 RepID=UPI00289693CA|nr:uncharacterized protein LOC132283504 [Cornus florida]
MALCFPSSRIQTPFFQMALCFPSSRIQQALPNTAPLATDYFISSTLHFHRSFPIFPSNLNAWSGRCRATSPGPPPPPLPDPPTGKDPTPSPGPAATLGRLQDTLQIFFAVLFWMSLFFWASAWDGKNTGKPNKGSRFRR